MNFGTSVNSLFRLDGKIALVVGGARDLGRDMASTLAEAGAAVIVTSRDAESADRTARALQKEYGVDTTSFALDQREHRDVADVMARATAWKGRLDILVNNAGGGSGASPGHLLKREPADAVNLITVNLTGSLHCCQEAAKIMVPQGGGKIINIASVAGMIGRDRRIYDRNGMKGQPIDYAAAKAGVIGMTRDLAALLGPHNICVNAISPGGFRRDTLPQGFVADYSDRSPLRRMGRDGIDIKGATLFLASPASDYVTGQNLVVDGGFSLWR